MNDSIHTTDRQCPPAGREREATRKSKAQPLWHARETDDGAVVEIALPGVAKEALSLEIGDRFLRLDAPRRERGEKVRTIRGEEPPAGYELKLQLDGKLDGDRAEARLEDGLLTVTLPLAEAAKPRRIEVG